MYNEVSEAAWQMSRTHALSVFITHPLGMGGMAFLLFRYIFPRFMRGDDGANASRIQAARESGPELVSGRCGGRLGEIQFSAPLLRVSVFPAGVLIKPIWMAAKVILASELRGVAFKRQFLATALEVDHSGVDVASPVLLYVSRDSALGTAIEKLHSGRASSDALGVPSAVASRTKSDALVRFLGVYGLIVNVGIVA